MQPKPNPVCLYELALENGRSASPFVWRIRYALAHKGIPFETKYLGFIEIPSLFGGKFKTVPILEHGDTALAESWDIADYLDRADRATYLPAIRASLAPLRAHLQKFPFLGGAAPNFADYIALGGFYWAASAGTLPLLE